MSIIFVVPKTMYKLRISLLLSILSLFSTCLYGQEPTTNASNVTFANLTCTSVRIQWTNGNGAFRIVIIKEGSAVDGLPVDGTQVIGWNVFKNNPSTELGSNNWVIYNSNGSAVNFSGLNRNTTYHGAIIEYNNGVNPNYLTSSYTTFSFTTHNILLNFSFSIDKNDSCEKTNKIIFKNNSITTFGNTTYRWYFKDNKTVVAKDTWHSYQIGGQFYVDLEVQPNMNCPNRITSQVPILIIPRPQSVVVVNDSIQCFKGHEFKFKDDTRLQGVPKCSYGRVYDFNDGEPKITMPSFTKYFKKSGIYMLNYVAETYYDNIPTGCTDTLNYPVKVIPDPGSGADVDDSIQCLAGNTFYFSNTLPNLISYKWDFGDGNSSLLQNINHSYLGLGNYSVIHEAIDAEGCSSQDTIIVLVKENKNATWQLPTTRVCESKTAITLVPQNANGIFSGATLSGTDKFIPDVPGFFTIKYLIKDSFCPDSVSKQIRVLPLPKFNLGPDAVLCEGADKQLNISAAGSYIWNDGSNTQSKTVNTSGLFWAEASDSGCTWRDSVLITAGTEPKITLPEDTLICKGSLVVLKAKWPGSTVRWNTGSTDTMIFVFSPGTYSVSVTNPCGTATDEITVNVQDKDCDLFIPTAFTPDGNNINDIFTIEGKGITPRQLLIFNNWGEKVFDSDKSGKFGWDGSFNSKECYTGLYIFQFKYEIQGPIVRRKSAKGTFMLLR